MIIINSSTREYISLGTNNGVLYIRTHRYILNTFYSFMESNEYIIDPQCEGSDDNILSSSDADPVSITQSMINVLNLIKL